MNSVDWNTTNNLYRQMKNYLRPQCCICKQEINVCYVSACAAFKTVQFLLLYAHCVCLSSLLLANAMHLQFLLTYLVSFGVEPIFNNTVYNYMHENFDFKSRAANLSHLPQLTSIHNIAIISSLISNALIIILCVII